MGFLDRLRRPEYRTPSVEIERRDPTAATRSLRWVSSGRPQPPDWDAMQAFRIANNTVLTCIERIADFLVKCPFRVGADPAKPSDYDPKAPLARLLGPPPGGPNPTTTARQFWKWTVGQRIMAGRFAWEIEVDGDRPVALWALPVSSCVPVPSESGVQYFSGFEFGKPGEMRKLSTDRVLYDWIPAADDWRQPDPPLRRAYLDVMIAVMQSQYDYAFLKNDARPATLVITEPFAERDDYLAFQQQWRSTYQGAENAGRAAFLEVDGGEQGVSGAVDVKSLGITQKDAQAAQRYTERLELIASALGVPWSILNASGRTYDNASQEWLNFVHGTLEPLACALADAINLQLASRLGPSVGWFDLSSLGAERRAEPVSAKVGAPALVQAQLFTIDEARNDYGLAPLPDGQGDRLMTAEEIAALGGASTTPDAVVRLLESFEARMVERLNVRTVPEPAHTQPVPSAPPDEPLIDEMEVRRTKIWNASSAKVRNLEHMWEEAIAKLFTRQGKSVLARLEAKRGRQARATGEIRALADEVFDPEHWAVETADAARVLYKQVVQTAGEGMADQFGIAFELQAPFVEEFVTSRANQLAGNVTQTTYEAIQATLTEGVQAGEGVPELSDRVREVFDVASKSRSVTIARTEVIGAYNGAGDEVARTYPSDVVAGKEWIATRDTRTRDLHEARDGEIVAMGSPFSGGLTYPGDPSGSAADVINCRCTVAFLTPKEYAERSGRAVPAHVAHVVMALVRAGEFDERGFRAALRLAA